VSIITPAKDGVRGYWETHSTEAIAAGTQTGGILLRESARHATSKTCAPMFLIVA
jgi:hypothetical protein